MSSILHLTKEELAQREISLRRQYNNFKTQHLALDMSRGKPGVQQLDLTLDMLTCVSAEEGYLAASGMDVRNYGLLDGLPEIKALFADILGVTPDQVIVGGNSSLNMMFDYISTCYSKGVCGHTPWCKQEKVKFLCPVPGYDRHFAITEYFGVEMIPVKMTPYGPKMEEIEELVKDPTVKGMWCVPMYSNPDGITYSDDTVRRLAALKPAAPDFRIIWDNAYCLHHLEEEGDVLLNIYDELKKHGNEDMVVMFTSTSKISFPGSGVAALAASPANVADVKKRMTVQTIGHDKLNMLRHIRFFKDLEGIKRHMKLHAAVLHPRFRVVLDTLETQLGTKDVAHWHQPRGGYFVSVNLMDGCAKRTIQLLKEAGVVMTPAGATFPYGNDPRDRNIRIAPSYPSVEDLSVAMELFCLCAELACVEKLLTE
ncbi:MAG: aminotransferase class I/II-fold pyridoxal phosphate-dependent enzyme [Clostridia bacterium]|nr:aminotransferase class I/II-fold pyridoxal phosphate-dependent enzyme [Clostridia bacterium]